MFIVKLWIVYNVRAYAKLRSERCGIILRRMRTPHKRTSNLGEAFGCAPQGQPKKAELHMRCYMLFSLRAYWTFFTFCSSTVHVPCGCRLLSSACI